MAGIFEFNFYKYILTIFSGNNYLIACVIYNFLMHFKTYSNRQGTPIEA